VTTKCVLKASSTHAANDREVAEREGLICVCKNEFFNGPNLPGGNIPFGSIYERRIVVSKALQNDWHALRRANSSFRCRETLVLSGTLDDPR
jgi:hypothetical protein